MTQDAAGDTPPRPTPLYGEYASPEEVAALRAAGDSPAVDAVKRESVPEGRPDADRARQLTGWRRFDRPLTIALVLLGIINLVQYSGSLLDFEGFLESVTADTAYASIDFGDAARIGGVVLFGVIAVIVALSAVVSYHRSREGRIAFWIPLVAGALSALAVVGVLTVVVLQTPGAFPLPGG